jgi:Outer membrane lipoprotein-sorting protein
MIPARPLLLLPFFFFAIAVARAALPAIPDPAHDPRWRDLFAALSADTARVAVFEERRHFPFRKKPVVLTGELRLAPGRGLSLRYLAPDPQTLIGDEQGIVVRDARGRTRTPPNDARAQAAASVLVDVLHFDLHALQQDFAFSGERTGDDDWILQLVPRSDSVSNSLGALTLTGHGTTLERIEITRAANQRIEILIRDARENVEFSGSDLKRYFR